MGEARVAASSELEHHAAPTVKPTPVKMRDSAQRKNNRLVPALNEPPDRQRAVASFEEVEAVATGLVRRLIPGAAMWGA